MKYKTIVDADGKVIGIAMDDKGNPIVIQEGAGENGSDKEIGLDAIHLYSKVPSLQEEAKNHRLKGAGYKEFLDALEEADIDITDIAQFKAWVEEATGAIGTVKNLDDKQLIDAKEVESIKKQAVEAHEKKVKELAVKHGKQMDAANTEKAELEQTVFDLMVADQFSNSPFVKEKLNMPAKVARAYFGKNFKVEKGDDGKFHVISYHGGEKLFSEQRVGEAPDFEEAIALMVARDPEGDSLMVGSGSGGSGAGDGHGGGGGGGNTNPFVKGKHFNLTEQGKIYNTDPQRAERLKAEATIINGDVTS
ncbi:MAG: DUF6651 domain-containing protein [Planctomycetota bacterium]